MPQIYWPPVVYRWSRLLHLLHISYLPRPRLQPHPQPNSHIHKLLHPQPFTPAHNDPPQTNITVTPHSHPQHQNFIKTQASPKSRIQPHTLSAQTSKNTLTRHAGEVLLVMGDRLAERRRGGKRSGVERLLIIHWSPEKKTKAQKLLRLWTAYIIHRAVVRTLVDPTDAVFGKWTSRDKKQSTSSRNVVWSAGIGPRWERQWRRRKQWFGPMSSGSDYTCSYPANKIGIGKAFSVGNAQTKLPTNHIEKRWCGNRAICSGRIRKAPNT